MNEEKRALEGTARSRRSKLRATRWQEWRKRKKLLKQNVSGAGSGEIGSVQDLILGEGNIPKLRVRSMAELMSCNAVVPVQDVTKGVVLISSDSSDSSWQNTGESCTPDQGTVQKLNDSCTIRSAKASRVRRRTRFSSDFPEHSTSNIGLAVGQRGLPFRIRTTAELVNVSQSCTTDTFQKGIVEMPTIAVTTSDGPLQSNKGQSTVGTGLPTIHPTSELSQSNLCTSGETLRSPFKYCSVEEAIIPFGIRSTKEPMVTSSDVSSTTTERLPSSEGPSLNIVATSGGSGVYNEDKQNMEVLVDQRPSASINIFSGVAQLNVPSKSPQNTSPNFNSQGIVQSKHLAVSTSSDANSSDSPVNTAQLPVCEKMFKKQSPPRRAHGGTSDTTNKLDPPTSSSLNGQCKSYFYSEAATPETWLSFCSNHQNRRLKDGSDIDVSRAPALARNDRAPDVFCSPSSEQRMQQNVIMEQIDTWTNEGRGFHEQNKAIGARLEVLKRVMEDLRVQSNGLNSPHHYLNVPNYKALKQEKNELYRMRKALFKKFDSKQRSTRGITDRKKLQQYSQVQQNPSMEMEGMNPSEGNGWGHPSFSWTHNQWANRLHRNGFHPMLSSLQHPTVVNGSSSLCKTSWRETFRSADSESSTALADVETCPPKGAFSMFGSCNASAALREPPIAQSVIQISDDASRRADEVSVTDDNASSVQVDSSTDRSSVPTGLREPSSTTFTSNNKTTAELSTIPNKVSSVDGEPPQCNDGITSLEVTSSSASSKLQPPSAASNSVKTSNPDQVAPTKLPWTALSDLSWDALYR